MNDEMDAGGGSKRPFGPHGEGCTCDWEEGEPSEEDESQYAQDDPISPQERMYTNHLPLGLQAMSATMIEHFLAGLDTAAASGSGLTRPQVIAMLSTLMTGYADSCELVKNIEQELRLQAQAARSERKAREAEQGPPVELHDVSDIFTVPPPQDEGPGPGSPDDN
jgi:hypothetical protein